MEWLLLVDDDADILHINKRYLEKQGFGVETAKSAAQALAVLEERQVDCIVLDIKMEGGDGIGLCRQLKARLSVPVLFLTGLSEHECLEEGFLSGGDDYLTKPYNLRELELRIRARLRGAAQRPQGEQAIQYGELRLEPAGRQAFIAGESLQLTASEFAILQLLVSTPGVPYTQEEIYCRIWGGDGKYNSHSVQTLIVRIRRKLEDLSPACEYIKTVWGRGYMFCRRHTGRDA